MANRILNTMTVSAAMMGNQNARRGSEWRDALRKAWMQYEDKETKVKRGQALYHVGLKVVKMALAGEMDAIRELGNRADGKPVQVQEVAVQVDVRSVLLSLHAKVGMDDAKQTLIHACADNLLPLLEQLNIETPQAIKQG